MNPPHGMDVRTGSPVGGHRRSGIAAAGGDSNAGGGPDRQAALRDPGRHLGVDGPGRGPDADARRRLARAPRLRPRRQRPLRRQQDVPGQGGPARHAARRSARSSSRWPATTRAELGQTCSTAAQCTPDGLRGQRLRRRALRLLHRHRTRPTTTNAGSGRGCVRCADPDNDPIARLLQRLDLLPGGRAHRAAASGWPATWWCRSPAAASNLRAAGQLDRRPGGLPRRHQPGAARIGHHAHRRRAERRPRLAGQRRQHASGPGAGIAQPRRPGRLPLVQRHPDHRRPGGRTSA